MGAAVYPMHMECIGRPPNQRDQGGDVRKIRQAVHVEPEGWGGDAPYKQMIVVCEDGTMWELLDRWDQAENRMRRVWKQIDGPPDADGGET